MSQNTPRRPRTLGAQEWLLALGALTGVALFIAAFLDFGDPMERARLEVGSGAADRAKVVELSWERLMGQQREPAEALGERVTIGPEGFRETDFAKEQEASVRIAEVRIEAALFEAAAGEMAQAVELMEAVLEGAPDDPRAAEAHLHLARWASARGDVDTVDFHRAAIVGELASTGLPSCWVGGTSVALLSSLVAPADLGLARRLLEDPAAHLPRPDDRAQVVNGELRIQRDPWWSVLRERLIAADSDVDSATDWGAVFRWEARAGDAVAELLGSKLIAKRDVWTLQRYGSAWLAARAVDDGVRVLAVDGAGLAESMAESMGEGVDDRGAGPYFVRWSPEPEHAFEIVLEEQKLGGGALAYSVHRDDPLASGRRELLQTRLVRTALVVLSLAILVASIMSSRATDRSRRLSLLRSTFVASVSHDLRTPIQSMLLMSETLEQNRVTTETGRQRYFGSIRREAQRLRRLVEDLLDGARIDRGEGARLERQDVDTERYFTELEAQMVERAERADGELTFVRGVLPESLYFDPDGVHRALWNLFENALKYGRQPGETARITIEVAVEDQVLAATVHDDGPGVPARFADTVFSPFERVTVDAEGGDIEKDTGTGLGLAIVRAVTRAHGGDARLDPSSRGARFVATFPASSPT